MDRLNETQNYTVHVSADMLFIYKYDNTHQKQLSLISVYTNFNNFHKSYKNLTIKCVKGFKIIKLVVNIAEKKQQ